jgi:Asp-tRNA(Asn)/Glu-tRNA(Gln) amidotransferase A subunit family amidase
MSSKRDYSELMRAVAGFRGYPYPDRLEKCKQRLVLNDKGIEAIMSAPEMMADGLYLSAPPVPPQPDTADRFEFPLGGERDIWQRSAGEIAALVSSHDLSPVDVASAFVDRAEQRRDLNAFITLDRKKVLQEAEALASKLKRTRSALPLAGVPVAIKDALLVRDYPFTCGTKLIEPKNSTRDADAVARLRNAGAVVIGTTNLDELGYAATGLYGPFGAIINPAAPHRVPGGSSGGSAAAVAAGLAPVALGTDTGGALRIPASCCGIVGLKPTQGAISNDGFMLRSPTLDSIGPMTKTVADCALVFEVLAGRAIGSTLGANPGAQKTFRFAKPTNFFFEDLEAPVEKAMSAAIERLKAAGCTVSDTQIPDIELSPAAHFMTVGPEAAEVHWGLLVEKGQELGEDLRARLEAGQFVLAMDYIKAQRIRQRLRDNVVESLNGFDVLLTPTLLVVPPEIAGSNVAVAAKASGLLGRLTGAFNTTGLPAITIPCGAAPDGTPIGLQLAGRAGDERTVMRAAYFCEQLFSASGA